MYTCRSLLNRTEKIQKKKLIQHRHRLEEHKLITEVTTSALHTDTPAFPLKKKIQLEKVPLLSTLLIFKTFGNARNRYDSLFFQQRVRKG